MASTQAVSTANLPAAGAHTALPTYVPGSDNFEMIWKMGYGAMGGRNGEFTVPYHVVDHIDEGGKAELKRRVEQFIGAPTLSFLDPLRSVWGVTRKSDSQDGLALTLNEPTTEDAGKKQVATTRKLAVPRNKVGNKIPRPANAFILYRQHWHPKIKEELGSDYHNNRVSMVIGEKWRQESVTVKNNWRREAERRKKDHYALHPEYVYAPRKPGEKKRRTTARKAKAKANLTPTAENAYYEHVNKNKVQTILPASPAALDSMVATHDSGLDLATVRDFDPLRDQFSNTLAQSAEDDFNLSYSMVDFRAISKDFDLVLKNAPAYSTNHHALTFDEMEEIEIFLEDHRALFS